MPSTTTVIPDTRVLTDDEYAALLDDPDIEIVAFRAYTIDDEGCPRCGAILRTIPRDGRTWCPEGCITR